MSLSEPCGPGTTPALSVRRLSKRFGGASALQDVAFDLAAGEVHGLLGQNGSGKSTLIKILSGFHAPESGAEISVYGDPVSLPIGPHDPMRLGIAFVHQNLGLIPSVSVIENLRMAEFSKSNSLYVNWRAEAAAAAALFRRFGIDIDPKAQLSDLSQVQRALVAIVRAFDTLRAFRERTGRPGILVLDEPTPFLPRDGVRQLFALVRSIKAEGASVIFVSHDIGEIAEITDRVTVLRDGKVAGTKSSTGITDAGLVELIVGLKVDYFQTARADLSDGNVAARVKDLSGAVARDVSFDLHEGEVLGVTGLIGSGYDEVPSLIYGARRATSGSVEIAGSRVEASRLSPGDAMSRGIAFLPADRLGRAGVGSLSASENLVMPILPRFRSALGIDWTGIRRWSHRQNTAYGVRPDRPDLDLQNFSGGNQQKVLLAKWLQTEPKVLLLDEPTQGVDVGARQTIFQALDRARRNGMAIICASSDAEQLAQICHRVLVFARGTVVAELTGDAMSKDRISEACLMSASLAANFAPPAVEACR